MSSDALRSALERIEAIAGPIYSDSPAATALQDCYRVAVAALATQSAAPVAARPTTTVTNADTADINRLRDAVIEECARVCDAEAQAHLSQRNMNVRTEAGQEIARAMGYGAQNCATRIRALTSKDIQRDWCADCDMAMRPSTGSTLYCPSCGRGKDIQEGGA
jgi:hypothetical protein